MTQSKQIIASLFPVLNMFEIWCNQNKLLHHLCQYFQNKFFPFKRWCNQNRLLHHYFQTVLNMFQIWWAWAGPGHGLFRAGLGWGNKICFSFKKFPMTKVCISRTAILVVKNNIIDGPACTALYSLGELFSVHWTFLLQYWGLTFKMFG